MNRWLYFLAAALLCLGVLLVSGADVNHGHGPGWTTSAPEGDHH